MSLKETNGRAGGSSGHRRERRSLAARAAKQNRNELYRTVALAVGDNISSDELDIHFTHMPPRYWTRVTAPTVERHLDLIHAFFATLHAEHSDGTTPVVRWHHYPDRGITEVEICTWDRLGLLAKVAGAFAAVGLNIVRADIYTRADNVVLDIFHISDETLHHVADEDRLHEMVRLLAAALKATPAALAAPAPAAPPARPPVVCFDVERAETYTPLLIEADDRVGLLLDIFTALAECDVNVVHAIVTTENGRTGDVFFLTDADDRKLTEPAQLAKIRERLLTRLG